MTSPNPLTAGCRFPLWPHYQAPTQQFCGAARLPGKPYCAEHSGQCYVAPAQERVPVKWNFGPKPVKAGAA